MAAPTTEERRGALRRRVLLSALVVGVVAFTGAQGAFSAFIAQTPNGSNSIASGTVILTDNDGASAMLSLSAAVPGATDTGCIKVTYDGSLPSTVRLYGTTTGTGLDQYLDLEVTRGAYSPSEPGFDSCTNFVADATNYIGAGAGVVYSGTLAAYADSYAAGLVDPTAASPESWTNAETHVYRIKVTLQDSSAAEGKNATQEFTWEARNQ